MAPAPRWQSASRCWPCRALAVAFALAGALVRRHARRRTAAGAALAAALAGAAGWSARTGWSRWRRGRQPRRRLAEPDGWLSTPTLALLAGGGHVALLLTLLAAVDHRVAHARWRCARRSSASTAGARTDALTGLPNRLTFEARAGPGRARADARSSEPLALLFIGARRLQAGQRLLRPRASATCCCATLAAAPARGWPARATCVARVGGDEFVMLLGGDPDAARPRAVAQRLLDALGRALRARRAGRCR